MSSRLLSPVQLQYNSVTHMQQFHSHYLILNKSLRCRNICNDFNIITINRVMQNGLHNYFCLHCVAKGMFNLYISSYSILHDRIRIPMTVYLLNISVDVFCRMALHMIRKISRQIIILHEFANYKKHHFKPSAFSFVHSSFLYISRFYFTSSSFSQQIDKESIENILAMG